jgi:hypothetical protein
MCMSIDKSKSKYEGVIVGLCPVCGRYIRHPESIYRGPNQHRCPEHKLQSIDNPRRRSGRNPARSEGERIEEGFKMMEIDD